MGENKTTKMQIFTTFQNSGEMYSSYKFSKTKSQACSKSKESEQHQSRTTKPEGRRHYTGAI